MIKITDNQLIETKEVKQKAFLVAFGKRVRELRERKGKKFSQEELSKLSGLHRNYISDAERGTRNVSLVAIFKIIQGLNITIADFFAEGFENQIIKIN